MRYDNLPVQGGEEMKKIDDLRNRINEIDEKIMDYLKKRAKIAIKVGEEKKKMNARFHVPEREKEIYARLEKLNPGPFPTDSLKSVFREIISASLSIEMPLKIAYLGPQATFTHLACLQKFGFSAQYLSLDSIQDVFNEVERGRATYGVVPIENSIEGVVNHTLDMFVESNLNICAEISQEISHNLLSVEDDLASIRKIYSHPHVFPQCKAWLEKNMPRVTLHAVSSTAKAAEMAAKESHTGAIASEAASFLYGLKIVTKKIEDNINNRTRFLVIGKEPVKRTGHDKTSLLFSIKDKAGALYEVLAIFAKNKINMTKIESRPSRKRMWEYIFFVDIEGHREDATAQKALEKLSEKCIFLKVLGSYPKEK